MLPVVERGTHVLGKRGLNARMLESELVNLLDIPARDSARSRVTEISIKPAFVPENPAPQRSTMLRRRYRDRDHVPMGS